MSHAIHCSRIEEECPHRAHQYEIRAWQRPPFVPFLRGSAAHAAREWALTRYMEDKELPSIAACQETGATALEIKVAEESERGSLPPTPEEVTEALDVAFPLIEADCRLVLPRIAPHVLAVEEKLEASIGEEWTLTGTLDARGRDPLTGFGTLSDLKTAERSPGDRAVVNAALSLQLSAYSLLHNLHYGTIPVLSLQYVWQMKRGPKAETIEKDNLLVCDLEDGGVGVARTISTQRSPQDLDAALQRLRVRIDQEKHGWYVPAFSGFLSPCSRCKHWGHEDPSQRCEYVPQVRPATAKEDETNE